LAIVVTQPIINFGVFDIAERFFQEDRGGFRTAVASVGLRNNFNESVSFQVAGDWTVTLLP
jgi:hypothetical protein